MIYLQLFYEFFKIGIFAIGGGMAAIPFLQKLSETSGWYDIQLVSDMIAISESTPGPIGINMATYVGYNVAGLLGGVIATLGIVTPAVIIVTLVSKSLAKFSSSPAVKNMFYGLRPAVTGLILSAGYSVMKIAFLNPVNYIKIAIFAVMFILIRKVKWHPIVFIGISALLGIILGL